MSKGTTIGSDQSQWSDEYRRRLRSYQTLDADDLRRRRSPRFLPQKSDPVIITTKNQPSSRIIPPSVHKTHPHFPPLPPTTPQISSNKKTQQRCSKECHNEPFRSIENLQQGSSCNGSQRKSVGPFRRSPRLASTNSSADVTEESFEPKPERRRSTRLIDSAKVVSEKKDKPGIDVLNGDKGNSNLGVREVKERRQRPIRPSLDCTEAPEKEKMGIDGEKEREDRDSPVILKMRECGENKKRRKMVHENHEDDIGSKKIEEGKCCGTQEWTKEQEAALQRAYLAAKPSPHFWKKVSRMVSGKSAQECFDRINDSLTTPSQPQPRSRTSRSNLSPVGNFSLSGSKSIEPTMPLVKKLSNRKKSLVAQKTVRHLLRKHCVDDQGREADHFSVLETSPTALAVDFPETSASINPDCISSPPGFLQKCSGGFSSTHQKMLSSFKPSTKANRPSPEVLKRIKNMALHERYINQLHNREARRKYVAARDGKIEGGLKTGVNVARTALMSRAKEFISQFQRIQDNSKDIDDADDE